MADSIYWTNYADNAIRGAPLAGGGNVETLYELAQGALAPTGIAIYAAAGRIYWANYGGGSIRGAPLAGGLVDTLYGPGPVVSVPGGVAVDPAAGRIYWANEADNTIHFAPLAGGANANNLYQGTTQGVNAPGGVAIDPPAGRIYWANGGDNTIRAAPLSGAGNPVPLYGPGNGVSGPYGVAIDAAAGRIYWANVQDDTIRGAPLAGGGSVDTLYGPADGVSDPYAVAIDPADAISIIRADSRSGLSRWIDAAAGTILDRLGILGHPKRPAVGRIYWTNNGDNTIRGAELTVGGAVDTLYAGTSRGVNWPYFLALLRAPVGSTAPILSGAGLGQQLSCSRGTWAADLLGSHLWRAPQSFAYQWIRDGTDIGGATLRTYTPTVPGNYACRVIATNRAGSTPQTSAPVTL